MLLRSSICARFLWTCAGLGSTGESDSGSAEIQSKKRGAKPKYKFSTEAEAVAMRYAQVSPFR